MSKTQVTKEVESKSQLFSLAVILTIRCQRPKLLKKLKANHNIGLVVTCLQVMSKTQVTKEVESKSQPINIAVFVLIDVKDPSY